MRVSELIEALRALQAEDGDLPVELMFDHVGTLPLAQVKTFGTVLTRVKNGTVRPDLSKGVLSCTLIAHVPASWGMKHGS